MFTSRNLRAQLLFSHFVLVLLMGVVIVGAVVNFFRLGRSIDRILKDNYKSVIAAQDMKEALERQDSAAAFYLANHVDKARSQYRQFRPMFERAYRIEAGNITEAGEQQVANEIGSDYAAYRRALEKLLYADPPMPPHAARDYYFGTLEPAFRQLKDRAQTVLDLNQRAILEADARAKREARWASWTSVGVALAAFLLAIFMAMQMIRIAMTPLLILARHAEEIGEGRLNQRIELRRTDEIGMLAEAFNRMTTRLQELRHIEEQRLHRAQRMSDAALEDLYDPVIVTDAVGIVVHLNKAAAGLFGPAQRAAGKPVAKVVQDKRIVDAILRAVRQDHVSAEEGEGALVSLPVGEQERTYRLRATPMRDDDGERLGAAVVLEDISHLRELDRLKTEFISVASHELRTPVTSLLLAVRLLQRPSIGDLNPRQKEIVSAQQEDLDRLDRMIRDLLDMTRLEAGATPPRFQIVRPADLVNSARESVEAEAAAKGLTLSCTVASGIPEVRADQGQVTRALINLLHNAVRHTPPGGKVTLDVRPQDGTLAFAVQDTGNGIPPEWLPRIFERFVQVPSSTPGGSGLGLSIAQTIARSHGGGITVESEVGKGSTFTMTLPRASERPAQQEME